MVPHVVPPSDEVRHHAVVLEPDELAEYVGAVQLVKDTKPNNAIVLVARYWDRAVGNALLCPGGGHLREPVW